MQGTQAFCEEGVEKKWKTTNQKKQYGQELFQQRFGITLHKTKTE